MSWLSETLEKYPFVILDGALGTEVANRGFDTNDDLWSAKALYEAPELLYAIHRDYYEAGADIVTCASYQATLEGFKKKGFSESEAVRLIRLSVELAKKARDEARQKKEDGRPLPLAAASVGPYGAYLADGSEYHGNYGLTEDELYAFHAPRIRLLAETEPDFFAVETLPTLTEAKAVAKAIMDTAPGIPAWVSFSCRDAEHTTGGDRLSDCAAFLDAVPSVAAVGINCSPPEYVASLIREVRKETDKPVAVYPNSGEHYDPSTKTWHGTDHHYACFVKDWYEAGARLIGGCCRTTPEDIRHVAEFRKKLIEKNKK